MLRFIKTLVFGLILSLLVISSVYAKCPVGDLNGDCRVDFLDVQVLAQKWLEATESSADLDGDDRVDMDDFALLTEQWRQIGVPLAINELMASNSNVIRDPQGEYDDWVEIYNYGNDAIDIGGMYLTDDLTAATKWRIPGNNPSATTLGPGGYLVIWADNDTTKFGLHAGFKLNAGGEEIGLFDSDGVTLIDSVTFPDQTVDISFGRYPDANDNRRFFGSPSPGAENNGAYRGVVADTKFSYGRGFYDTPFSVTIATETEDATIYYSLDGSEPYDVSGRTSIGTVYTDPIAISSTTCLRAKAIRHGWKHTNTDAQTYIFLDDVINQPDNPPGFHANDSSYRWGHAGPDYEMDPDVVTAYSSTIKDDLKAVPSLSLAMGVDDWFNSSSDTSVGGIYANPPWEDNYREQAERAVSVELIDPCGLEEFQINAAVRIAGGTSTSNWKMDKLSMRLKFTGKYGLSKLRFPVFGADATDQFDTLVLDARMNNSWAYGGNVSPSQQRRKAQYTRDQFVSDIQNATSGYAPAGRHVHLYLNGLYWGLYWLHERPDEHFAAAYFGGEDEDYDVLKHHSSEVINGSGANYSQMFNIANSGLDSSEQYQLIRQYLDVPNLIDYMITNLYVGNTDWAHQNWYATRNRVDPDSRWRYHSWDAEHVMEGISENRTGRNDSGGPTRLHHRLTENAEYRLLFADHVHRHFFNDGVLNTEGATALYQVRLNEVDRAVVGESARWGDNHRSTAYTRDVDWVRERDWLLNEYFPQRSGVVFNQFKSRGWYPNVDAPVFHINNLYQHGGQISPDDMLSMAATADTIWYTIDGNDPRLSDEPQNGDSDTTLVAENVDKKVLVPIGPVNSNWKSAMAFNDLAWDQCTGSPGGVGYERTTGYEDLISLDLREKMYGKNATCYIRIPFTFNGDPDEFDSMKLKVRYDDAFVAYLNGAELARPNFTGTPTWNSHASEGHSDPDAVNFEDIDISAYLSTLQQGNNLLAIHGLNASTTSADFLISVELIASEGGSVEGVMQYTGPISLSQSAHVKARVLSGSTWSALNEAVFAIGPVADNLRITEIMYHPQNPTDPNDPNDPNEEFIELKNIGTETINLNLVSFTNGIDFTFPSIELAAGEYVVVVQDRAAFEAKYGTSINIAGQYSGRLNNGGEKIILQDAIGQTILEFSYKDGWRSITDGEGFSLTIIAPTNPNPNSWDEKDSWRASAYAGGSPGDDDSGIVPDPGAVVINEVLAHSHDEASDWIELYNTTGNTIDIGGWLFSDSKNNLAKYEIPKPTTIGPYNYIVFREDLHFNNASAPGSHEPFALSENGERLYLSSAENGVITGYRRVEDFGASATGVSFGRYYKASTDNYNFVPMEYNTQGSTNSYPKVGPIVISEIMYNPDWPAGGSYTNDQYEYVELHNISAESVTLYRYDKSEPWRFTDGIEFTFPDQTPVTIAAGGYLLLVKNPDAFSWRYPAVPADKILGPYDGKLSNAGERLELSMPGDVDKFGVRQYIRIDRITYSDGSHPEDCPGGVDLWPIETDGGGKSLTRKVLADYGNDPANWTALAPSPGE